ncbi:C4-dicarboxylate transporter [Duganella sp. FT135W]|uniref:C4-dicarboxylate transporter n=1 Tax=Duganella flavida TaxID=2692175 RepID=A0A6L8K9Z4_9BURK|nr:GAF domain-containing protein [Duganella flavida]MYM22722.1 C4-dicarboxylate transporter [Duganella flavida]
MFRFMEVVARYRRWSGTAALLCALVAGALAVARTRDVAEREQQQLLEIALQRHAVAAMSLTLDGNLMGAISLLGLISPGIKQESTGRAPPNTAAVQELLGSVARAHQAQAVFVVDRDGMVTSSWDDSGKPSTGLSVPFRPYFQMAMRGSDNVYAAISLSRGERTLYFSAPVYAGLSRVGAPVGAVVARTGMDKVNRLLGSVRGTALLLSPQGVVFASNDKQWLGQLAGPVTPERIAAIRALRQFGELFETRVPRGLPFDIGAGRIRINGRRYATAAAAVNWNDPAGQWQLVLLDDLSTVVAPLRLVRNGVLAGGVTLLLCLLLLRLLRMRLAQREATCKLEQMVREQALQAERQMQLARAALRMQQTEGAAAVVAVFLDECHGLFGALQGVVYTADSEDGPLRLAGSYAAVEPPAVIAFGEGLLGQCARERLPRRVDSGGAPWIIQSGLGQSAPATLLLVPVLLQARLLGVAELALPEPAPPQVQAHCMELAGLLAINLGFRRRSAANEETACDVC